MHQAIHLTSPSIRIVSLRRAAKNVPIPSALDARQRARTGISWILKAAEKGRKGGASERTGRIAKEVLAVLDGSSAALARKDEVHRLGAVNRCVGQAVIVERSSTRLSVALLIPVLLCDQVQPHHSMIGFGTCTLSRQICTFSSPYEEQHASSMTSSLEASLRPMWQAVKFGSRLITCSIV
jgi:hypothetical protein